MSKKETLKEIRKELEQMREQTDVYLKLVERDDIYVPFVIMDFKSKTMKLIRKIDGESVGRGDK